MIIFSQWKLMTSAPHTATHTSPASNLQRKLSTKQPIPAPPTSTDESCFYVKSPKASYNICDELEILIELKDRNKQRKTKGGDYMWPFIQTTSLQASAPADELIDHGNGTYTARFTLHWAGEIQPRVRFVYSSEHVNVLRNIRDRAPDRFAYNGKFRDKQLTEITPCHINKVIYVDNTNKGLSFASTSEVCDFSDVKSGTTWYCLKPKTLACSNFTQHIGSIERAKHYIHAVIKPDEQRIINKYK